MSTTMKIEQRRRAMLIQALEARWPGCGAHSKQHQVTGRNIVIFASSFQVCERIDAEAFIEAWEAGAAALLACLQAEAPFTDADTAALVRRQAPARSRADRRLPASRGAAGPNDRAARAQAGLEALFADGKGGQE